MQLILTYLLAIGRNWRERCRKKLENHHRQESHQNIFHTYAECMLKECIKPSRNIPIQTLCILCYESFFAGLIKVLFKIILKFCFFKDKIASQKISFRRRKFGK